MIHAKILIIDGIWSVVGSTNFDSRSFGINDEVNIAVLDPRSPRVSRRTFKGRVPKARRSHSSSGSSGLTSSARTSGSSRCSNANSRSAGIGPVRKRSYTPTGSRDAPGNR